MYGVKKDNSTNEIVIEWEAYMGYHVTPLKGKIKVWKGESDDAIQEIVKETVMQHMEDRISWERAG